MNTLSMLLLALSTTADSMIIGLNYGIKQVRVSNISNLFISLICLVGTYAAMQSGRMLGSYLYSGFCDFLGGAALAAFGLITLTRALFFNEKKSLANNPEAVDKDNSKIIELRESVIVGLLLSLNNMGVGIAAGIAGFSVVITPSICAVASFLFIKTGCTLGKKISGTRISYILELLSASLLLWLGIFNLV